MNPAVTVAVDYIQTAALGGLLVITAVLVCMAVAVYARNW